MPDLNKNFQVISTLSDKTRLEILSLLLKYNEGLTAAEISRRINKKIPSTIYQLEIIQNSGLITNEMKMVSSIGREIKHWILHHENYHILLNFNLIELIHENLLSIDIRNLYLDKLIEINTANSKQIDPDQLKEFNNEILSDIILLDGAKIKDKDKTKIIQLNAKPLLIDALINRLRSLLSNVNINEGYLLEIAADMLSITFDVIDLLINNLDKYHDIEFDINSKFIWRSA